MTDFGNSNPHDRPGMASIPSGVSFTGEAHFAGPVVIAGFFSGNLRTPMHLVEITEDGIVQGAIQAGQARIGGQLKGTIDCAAGLIEFTRTARCTAKARYRELDVARGAVVDAELHQMGDPDAAKM
jgi:cytoskeletal protein CcmA (bactofilin family)